jgi:hypothetical protein
MKRLKTLLYMCLGSSFLTTVAAASPPPEPSLRKTPAAWVGYGLMFIFFVIVVGVSLMSSKRGHQD